MWKTVKLGDICHKITDGSHNPPKGVEFSEYLMLSSKNIYNGYITYEKPRYLAKIDFQNENKRTDIQIGDVLLTIVGTIGRCAVFEGKEEVFTLQRSVAVLKPKQDLVLPNFLMLALQNMLEILNDGARGVAQKGIYLKSLKNLTISLPPLAEQQRIVAKLDAAFAEIDKSVSTIENKSTHVRTLFSKVLSDSIGKQSPNTKTLALKEVAKFLDYRGKTPSKSTSGTKLLTAKNVRMGYIKQKPEEFVSEKEYERHMVRGFPNAGDVVFTTEAPLGLVAQIVDDDVALGQRLITFQITNNVMRNEFLKYLLMSNAYQSEILKKGTGATVKGIKASLLKEISLSFPASLEEQDSRISKIEVAEEKCNEIELLCINQLEQYKFLKSAILAQELKGETA